MKFNHYTFNSGNLVVQDPKEFLQNAEVIAYFRDREGAMKKGEPFEIYDGYVCRGTFKEDFYVLSLENASGQIGLLTCGAKNEEAAEKAKELIHIMYSVILLLPPDALKIEMPEPPFVMDFIVPIPRVNFADRYMWTGDFCRCLGAVRLFLEKDEEAAVCAKKKEDDNGPADLAVGKRYAAYKNHPEGVLVDIGEYGITTTVFLPNITDHEKMQIHAGAPMEVKLLMMRGIIFFLYKFGDMEWMDAPYWPTDSNAKVLLPNMEEGQGIALKVIFADTYTGELINMRLVGLSTKFSKDVKQAIEEQAGLGLKEKDYKKQLQQIYAAYPTKKMVKFASSRYKAA